MKRIIISILAVLPLGTFGQSKSICAGEPIPAGWVKTNDSWNPTSCGNPKGISYNVIEIRNAAAMPVSSILNVCYDSPIPDGWEISSRGWNANACGHPKSNSNNVVTIIKRR